MGSIDESSATLLYASSFRAVVKLRKTSTCPLIYKMLKLELNGCLNAKLKLKHEERKASSENAKTFWSYCNFRLKESSSISAIVSSTGSVCTSDYDLLG
ncbi:hypothetical protein COOONC_26887 [Cooperia oncophora]